MTCNERDSTQRNHRGEDPDICFSLTLLRHQLYNVCLVQHAAAIAVECVINPIYVFGCKFSVPNGSKQVAKLRFALRRPQGQRMEKRVEGVKKKIGERRVK